MKHLILIFIAFTMSFAAQSAIVYTNISDYYLGYGDWYSIDIISGNNNDINFHGDGFGNLSPSVHSNNIVNDFSAIATINTNGPVKAYTASSTIGPAAFWNGSSSGMYINDPLSPWPNEFPVGQDRYIGVRIDDFGEIHYGWVLVEYESTTTLIIKAYAYESTPDVAIAAGATGSGGGGGGGGGGSSNWVDVRAAGGVTSVSSGGDVQLSAYIMPDDVQILSVDWSVVNGSGTATISGSGVLTGGNQGTITVYGDPLSFSQVAPGSLNLNVSGFANLEVGEAVSTGIPVYPIPADEYLNVDLTAYGNSEELYIHIFDVMGKLVLEKELSSNVNVLNISELVDGVYFLNIFGRENLMHQSLFTVN